MLLVAAGARAILPGMLHGGMTMAGAARFYGIYRATVLNDSDPMQLGRKQVLVPSVSGQGSGWAIPCVSGASAADISVGDAVWVMFEGGDPTAPVCMGSMAG